MKLALMFAGMAAGQRAGGPGELLKSGTKLLSSSPELARLTDEVRGRLMDAGKNAALAVAARQVESLTDRVGRRVESIGDLGSSRRRKSEEPPPEQDAEDEYAEEDADEPRDEPPEGTPEDEASEDETPEDETPDEDEAPAARRRPTRTRAAQRSGGRGGGAATASVRRGSSGTTGRAASRTGGKATGKATNGRRSPRTRKADSDG